MSDEKYKEIVQTIEFPQKRWFNNLTEATVADRKVKLEKWLNVRAQHRPSSSPPVLAAVAGGGARRGGHSLLISAGAACCRSFRRRSWQRRRCWGLQFCTPSWPARRTSQRPRIQLRRRQAARAGPACQQGQA